MSRQKIQLGDIDDAEAFVNSYIQRFLSKANMSSDVRQELVQQGLLIICDMHSKYEPDRFKGNSNKSKFSGYVAQFLPNKLRDAWHKLEGHRLVTSEDGRKWGSEKVVSIDQMMESDDSDYSSPTPQELTITDTYDENMEETLATSIDRVLFEERTNALSVGALLTEDIPSKEIQRRTGLRPVEIERAKDLIKKALRYVEAP